jgi:phosphoserine phosphatase RsbU/P
MPTAELSIVRKLELLLEVTNQISRSQDLQELLDLVMDTLCTLVSYDAAGIYVLQHPEPITETLLEHPHVFHTKALRGYEANPLTDIRLNSGEGLISYVVETGQPITSPDVRQDSRYIKLREETSSEMVAPIISNDEVIGVFDLESNQLNAYTSEDLQVLLLLASQVAIIIEKVMLLEQLVEKRRLEEQLEVARQVQLFLLPPRTPQLKNFDIAAYNYSTEEVSGDYYDFVHIYEDQLKFVIADVSGKGIPAALLMAFLRGSLRSAIQTGYATNVSMTRMNNLLWESTEQNQFVTAVYGVLDSTNKTMAFSNAGHNPPLLIDDDGIARYIEQGGLPLGLFRDTRYYEYFLQIEAGETLVLYTDGVTEAVSTSGEEYGRERLAQITREGCRFGARELINYIYADVLQHTEGQRPTDDVTFVIIKALKTPLE